MADLNFLAEMDWLGVAELAKRLRVLREVIARKIMDAHPEMQKEILRLREEARAALGDAFDIREFHRVVLENGSLPLVLLRRVVETWVRGQA